LLEKILRVEEERIYDESAHWINLLLPGIATIICILIAAFIGDLAFFSIVLLLALLFCGFNFLSWKNNRYIITTQRVIKTKGLFGKSVIDHDLASIEAIRISTDFFSYILNFGQVIISREKNISRSMSIQNRAKQMIFQRVANPLLFKNTIEEEIINIKKSLGSKLISVD
jgi:uncharacterized membrane protein YdbT with pleckstrin-like domain